MIPKFTLRCEGQYDPDEASNASGLSCPEPTLAQQQFKDDCDINTILERFAITGVLPQGVQAPQFGDFTDAMDYHSALNAVIAADQAFMALPASVRSRFNNDAGAFVEFCSDPANATEAEGLGLVVPRPGRGQATGQAGAAPAAGGTGDAPASPGTVST